MTITFDFPVWATALAIVFVLAWLIQFVLQLVIWLRPLRHAHKCSRQSAVAADVDSCRPGVSILVYSHNAGEALAQNLPLLMAQNYPDFEVIVLDDESLDDTQDVLTMMEQRYEHFYHSRIDDRTRAMSHRKLAVLLGCKAANHDLILMTHAECKPESDQWISNMVQPFSNPGIEMVLGPVVYERRKSFLSRFCQFDLFQRLLFVFGTSLAVRPFSGWGQNLAFRKDTFYVNKSQGFQRHLKMQPGEDDLFVSDAARDGNVAIVAKTSALMTDLSKPLFINWSLARLDRGFTSRFYAAAPRITKLVDSITRYLTVLPGLGLLAYTLFIIIGTPAPHASAWVLFGVTLFLLLVRMGLMIYTYAASSRAFHQRSYITWPIFLDLYMPLVDLWFHIKAGLNKKRFEVSRIGLR